MHLVGPASSPLFDPLEAYSLPPVAQGMQLWMDHEFPRVIANRVLDLVEAFKAHILPDSIGHSEHLWY